MVRIRKLIISGFRGARYPVTIDFTGSCKSIAVFGENATGKSSFTDGIEWFFKDKIEHLWREECKEEALRNVQIREGEDAIVQIEFSDKDLSCEKHLNSLLTTTESNKSVNFREYKAEAAIERLVLRTSYLTEFILKRKGKKREELAAIIGFEALTDFRAVIVSVLNALETSSEYIGAKSNRDTAQGKVLTLCGTVLTSDAQFFAKANELASGHAPAVTIKDEATFKQCVEELRQKIARQEQAETRLKLGSLKSACEVLKGAVNTATDSEARFLEPYGRLVKDREKIKLLDLEQFLSKGKDILARGLTEANKCPFCGGPVDGEHLRVEVEARFRDLESIRKEFEGTRSVKEKWLSDLRDMRRAAEDLERKWEGLEVELELAERVRGLPAATRELEGLIEEKFQRCENIEEDAQRSESERKLVSRLDERMSKADQEIKSLELTEEDRKILGTIQALHEVKSAFREFMEKSQVKDAFEHQIKAVGAIRDAFVTVQNESFQTVLDLMSDDINRYYLFLHPPTNENVDHVSLKIVGEEGIEFVYSFHGREVYPPVKYLSESHLNSLGLALFLASVKLFNKRNNFFVLDDVITSFDSNHRIRLLRLLQEEFKDWQILLLTHEGHWFDVIKKELVASGWLICETDWDQENGIQIRGTPEDLRALIALKRSQGHEVGNDLRTLLERVLKEICYALEVKLAFRYNDRNEERISVELLSGLRSTLNAKAAGVKDDSIFNQIETSNLIGTKSSHDRPKEVSTGDIDVALEDIAKLEGLFRCEACSRLATRDSFNIAEKKITCKCGKKEVSWKS